MTQGFYSAASCVSVKGLYVWTRFLGFDYKYQECHYNKNPIT